jgi:hypothetical protein
MRTLELIILMAMSMLFFYLHLTFLHIILDDLLTCFTLQVH